MTNKAGTRGGGGFLGTELVSGDKEVEENGGPGTAEVAGYKVVEEEEGGTEVLPMMLIRSS